MDLHQINYSHTLTENGRSSHNRIAQLLNTNSHEKKEAGDDEKKEYFV